MFINQYELELWAYAEKSKEINRVYGSKREPVDPKQKRKWFKRKIETKSFANQYKESKPVRKRVRKRFRNEWRVECAKGRWHRPVNREYHTYGHETW
ncbi:hypothetical protein bcgnr5378_38000 [Bacillus cereus]|uniref:hypothetical protein n=1 Tax=Bacillus cereus TaxID=1396 RepID=UPI0007AB3617|nr:hypothetical protein [Bacillus cereus]